MASLDVAAVSVVLTFTAAVGQSGCGAFLRVSGGQKLREPLDADAAAAFQTLAVSRQGYGGIREIAAALRDGVALVESVCW
jgi:hypothetical protein